MARCFDRRRALEVLTDDESTRLIAEFHARVEPLGVELCRVVTIAEAARAIAEWALAIGVTEALVAAEAEAAAPGLSDLLRERGLVAALPGAPERVRDAPLGVSVACLAVAETGSMLLAEQSLEDRAVGMLTLAQAIICPTRLLVSSLDEAAPVLRDIAYVGGRSMATLVTGPSRTADIERVLTVGVQGPGKIANIFIDEL